MLIFSELHGVKGKEMKTSRIPGSGETFPVTPRPVGLNAAEFSGEVSRVLFFSKFFCSVYFLNIKLESLFETEARVYPSRKSEHSL